MLCDMLSQHLQIPDLGEPFNPVEGRILGVRGKYLHIDEVPGAFQSREARFQTFAAHAPESYVYNLKSLDVRDAVIREWAKANNRIIAIERHNVFSGFLSALIANHHKVWHVLHGQEKPEYTPFVADEHLIRSNGKQWVAYYKHRDSLQPRIMYYEDIAHQSVEVTMKQAGVYQAGLPLAMPLVQKLHTFEQKKALVLNHEDVFDYLVAILTPFDVQSAYTEL